MIHQQALPAMTDQILARTALQLLLMNLQRCKHAQLQEAKVCSGSSCLPAMWSPQQQHLPSLNNRPTHPSTVLCSPVPAYPKTCKVPTSQHNTPRTKEGRKLCEAVNCQLTARLSATCPDTCRPSPQVT